jgi:Ca2+-binding RTX toxin-like protein
MQKMAFPGPFGTSDSETLSGSADADTFDALGGNDWLGGLAGNDSLTGGIGDDTLLGHEDDDTLIGQVGADLLWGGSGDDSLYGGDDNDTLNGDEGSDALFGDLGDDLLQSGSDQDTLNGGDGNDGLSVDHLDQVVFGGTGNDYITTGLYGWTTTFDIYGGADDDFVYVGRNSEGAADGGDGTGDLLKIFWYDPAFSLGPVVVAGGSATVDDLSLTFTGFERFDITAGAGNDSITTGDGDDTIAALQGANVVDAAGGDDVVTYFIGQANDLDGGSGSDTLRLGLFGHSTGMTFTVTGTTANDGFGSNIRNFEHYDVGGTFFADTVRLGAGNDLARGVRGDDLLYGGGGTDTLYGGARNDRLYGGEDNDMLSGGLGDDVLYGDAGNDRLFLAADLDVAFGGSGDDRIAFQAGSHTGWGEDGRDRFVFRTIDATYEWLGDFTSGEDKLVIWADQLGNAPARGRIAADQLVSGTMLTEDPQFLQYKLSSHTYLFWDPDGTAIANDAILIAILLNGETVQASDILIL